MGNLRPVGHMRPARNYNAARQAPRGRKMNMYEYCVYLATVVGAARDKNRNSFPFSLLKRLPTTDLIDGPQFFSEPHIGSNIIYTSGIEISQHFLWPSGRIQEVVHPGAQ